MTFRDCPVPNSDEIFQIRVSKPVPVYIINGEDRKISVTELDPDTEFKHSPFMDGTTSCVKMDKRRLRLNWFVQF